MGSVKETHKTLPVNPNYSAVGRQLDNWSRVNPDTTA